MAKNRNTLVELTDISKKITHPEDHNKKITVYQIKALKTVNKLGVKKGDLGGYVDSLDVFKLGNSWVDRDSIVTESILQKNSKIIKSKLHKVQPAQIGYWTINKRSVSIINSKLSYVNLVSNYLYIIDSKITNSDIIAIFSNDSLCSFDDCEVCKSSFILGDVTNSTKIIVEFTRSKFVDCVRIELTDRYFEREQEPKKFSITDSTLTRCCVEGVNIEIADTTAVQGDLFYKLDLVDCSIYSNTKVLNKSAERRRLNVFDGMLENSIVKLPKDATDNLRLDLMPSNTSIKGGSIEGTNDILSLKLNIKDSLRTLLFYKSREDRNNIVSNSSIDKYTNLACDLNEITAMIELIKEKSDYFKDEWREIFIDSDFFLLGLQIDSYLYNYPKPSFFIKDKIKQRKYLETTVDLYNKFVSMYENLINYVRVYFNSPVNREKVNEYKLKYNKLSEMYHLKNTCRSITEEIFKVSSLVSTKEDSIDDSLKSILTDLKKIDFSSHHAHEESLERLRNCCCCCWCSSSLIEPEFTELKKFNEPSEAVFTLPDNCLVIYKTKDVNIWKEGSIKTLKNTHTSDKIQVLPKIERFSYLIGTELDYDDLNIKFKF